MEGECGTSVDPVCLQALKAVVRRGV
jgi:hypothetical protein